MGNMVQRRHDRISNFNVAKINSLILIKIGYNRSEEENVL
jgi:hypothetical protein